MEGEVLSLSPAFCFCTCICIYFTGTSGVTGSKSPPTGTSKKDCTKQCKALVISIALLFILVIALTGCTVGLYLRMEDMGIANTNAQLKTTLEGRKFYILWRCSKNYACDLNNYVIDL